MCKKNKIDLNLLIDVNQAKFKQNIKKFIDQIESLCPNYIDYLNLFINGLTEQPSRDLEFLRPPTTEDRIKQEVF